MDPSINSNYVTVAMPEAGTTVHATTAVFMTDMREVIVVSSSYDGENVNLWTESSDENIEFIKISEDDREEMLSACHSIGVVKKRDSSWDGGCRSKIRLSPAVLQNEGIFFMIMEVVPGIKDEIISSIAQMGSVKNWIFMGNDRLLRLKENQMRKMFYNLSQFLDVSAGTFFRKPTIQTPGPTDRSQVANLLVNTLPTLRNEFMVKLISSYTPSKVSKLCAVNFSFWLAVMVVMLSMERSLSGEKNRVLLAVHNVSKQRLQMKS